MKPSTKESEYLRKRFIKAKKLEPGGVILNYVRDKKEFHDSLQSTYFSLVEKTMNIQNLIWKMKSINKESQVFGYGSY